LSQNFQDIRKEFYKVHSDALGFKRQVRDDDFLQSVFKWCRAPVVVITLDSICSGGPLHAVLRVCKALSYETKEVRFIVDLSTAWAALEVGIIITKHRVQGVYVSPLPGNEIDSFVSARLSKLGFDDAQLGKISQKTCDFLGGHILKLHDFADGAAKIMPKGDFNKTFKVIETMASVEDAAAFHRWNTFRQSYMESMLTSGGATMSIDDADAVLGKFGKLTLLLGYTLPEKISVLSCRAKARSSRCRISRKSTLILKSILSILAPLTIGTP
jgi:hypothetical protein